MQVILLLFIYLKCFFIILLVFLCNESSSCKATIMAQAKLCKSFVMDSWIISTTMIISLLTFFYGFI